MLPELGRIIVVIGVLLIFLGLVLSFVGKVPFLGRLPGDMLIKKDGFTFYFPLTTSILISVLFSLIMRLLSK